MVDFDLDLDGRFLSGIIINNDTKWFPPRNNDLPSWYRYCAVDTIFVSLFMMIPASSNIDDGNNNYPNNVRGVSQNHHGEGHPHPFHHHLAEIARMSALFLP
jgi:hypothetical protein